MRKSLFILILISFACKLVAQTPNSDSSLLRMELKVDSLLIKLASHIITEKEKKELTGLVYTIQNTGLSKGEARDFDESLRLVDIALNSWVALEDTLNEANNRKFKGLLHGKLNNFREAKSQIDSAIKLFSSKQKDWGVAVSRFNLSKVYEIENKLDSALIYSLLATDYWSTTTDTGRVLINNNQVMNVLIKLNDFDKAIQIQKDTEKLLSKENLYWQSVIDFYYISYMLFAKLENKIMSEKYWTSYQNKLDSLKLNNINARSTFLRFEDKK